MADDRFSDQPQSPNLGPTYAGSSDAPDLPSLAGGSDGGLNSLGQAAREKKIKHARIALIFVGIVTMAFNLYVLFGAIPNELKAAGLDPNNLPHQIQARVQFIKFVTVVFILMGGVFLGLAAAVTSYPVPCTVIGLILYLAGWGISIAFDPSAVYQGLLIKCVIIAALWKAVQAARAYETEKLMAQIEAGAP